MSVLIKNMEIPEHCGYCRFRYDGICHALQKTQYSVEECPLVSVNDINTVQRKGRWIDVDMLCEKMYHEAFETDSDEQRWDSGCWIRYKMFERVVNSMPILDISGKEGE